MPEYVIKPEKKELPAGPYLMEELHHRGFPVEINVKGSAAKWDAIRFYEPGPPEIECFLSFSEENGTYSASVSDDSPYQAIELQMFLVDLLLKEVGGRADNSATRERFTPQEFTAKLRAHHGSSNDKRELFWIGFSWVVVVLGVLIYFFSPQSRSLAPFIVFFSLLSAGGLTYSHFKR